MSSSHGSPSRARRRAVSLVAMAVAGSFAVAGFAAAGVVPTASHAADYVAYQDQSLTPQVRAADLVSRMTLSEKINQLRSSSGPSSSGANSEAIPRLGVKAYRYWNEAMHGVVGLSGATSFSSGLGIGATWNRTLANEMGQTISDEARAGANTGNGNDLTYWAPTINLARDPRWGRDDESYGEDPYLTGQLAGANVEGMQGSNPNYLKIVSTPKHYLANNAENYRRNGNSQLTMTDLREYYTPAFRQLISPEGADAQSLMTSYNAVNGTPSPANQFTIETLARRTFGFTGFITSDCDAILDIWQRHLWTPDGFTTSVTQAQAVAYAIKAGTDLACDNGNYDQQYIGADGAPAAIDQGLLTEDDIDVDLVRVFTVRFRLGEFDDATKVPYENKSVYGTNQIGANSEEHTAAAEEMSNEAPVLLRNNDVTGTASKMLPLQTKNVVTLGYMADEAVLGGYSGSPNPGPISTDQALTNAGYTVTHFDGITPKYGEKPGVMGVTFTNANAADATDTADVTYTSTPPTASRDGVWNWTGWRGIQYDPHSTNPTAMMPNEDWEGEFSLTGINIPASTSKVSVQQLSTSWGYDFSMTQDQCAAAGDTWVDSYGGYCSTVSDNASDNPTSSNQVLKGGHFVVHVGSATGAVVATIPADGNSTSNDLVAYDSSVTGATGSSVTLYFEYEPPAYTISLDATATAAVRNADAVIVDIGTRQSESSEEMDRATIDLPRYQDKLVQLARELNPKVVVWIQAVGQVNIESFRNDWADAIDANATTAPDGQPYLCGWTDPAVPATATSPAKAAVPHPCQNVPAIVWTNYNGQDQGQAAVRLLSGQANFSGKLTYTWYSNMNQMGGINDYQLTPNATNGTDGRTYWYTTADVSYPFGYGLSYSKFQYSNAHVSAPSITGDGTETVSVDVSNVSKTPGMETVELYLTSPKADGTTRPYEQLKGFQKISLAAGETKTVSIDVKASDLDFWDESTNAWTWDTGTWQYRIGANSETGKVGTFKITSAPTKSLETVMAIPTGVVLNTATPDDVIDAGLSATLNDDSFLDLSNPATAQVTYSSSNQKVATVNAYGQVSPVAAGNATITASVTYGGQTKSSTFPVIVYAGSFESKLGDEGVTTQTNLVDFGDQVVSTDDAAAGVQLSAKTTATDPTTFAYSIAPMDTNTAGATVTADGLLKATQAGTVRVTVVATTGTGDTATQVAKSAIVTVGALPAQPVDTSALATAITNAKDAAAGLDPADYTATSWNALQSAITAGAAVLASGTATADQVTKAADAITAAQAGLIGRGDVSPLVSVLAVADSLTAHQADYTATTWADLQSAANAADALVTNPTDASATAISGALANLRAALAGLKLVPAEPATPTEPAGSAAAATLASNQATLGNAIASLGTIDTSKYTVDSAAAFTKALAVAKAALAAKDATSEQLVAALRDLMTAVVKLAPTQAAQASVPTTPATASKVASHRPAIKGTAKVGKKLKATTYSSKWTQGATLTVKWYVNGKLVKTATTLKLKKAYKGKKVVVKVTGSLTGYTAVTRASKSKKVK